MQPSDNEYKYSVLFEGYRNDLYKLGFTRDQVTLDTFSDSAVIFNGELSSDGFEALYAKAELVRSLAAKEKISCKITYCMIQDIMPETVSKREVEKMLGR